MGQFAEPLEVSRGGVHLLVDCPKCHSTDLDVPEHPRGDDAVECHGCGTWFRFAELEACALDETRRMLARAFPFLPLESTL